MCDKCIVYQQKLITHYEFLISDNECENTMPYNYGFVKSFEILENLAKYACAKNHVINTFHLKI